MDDLVLVIGNKNYSSWSLRPWLVMRHFDIPFEEVRIPLYREGSREALAKLSPSGLVPALKNSGVTVWDSLAICEYLQELYPSLALWPKDRDDRAIARSISAEMHSGFSALRNHMPMNCRKVFPGKGLNPDTQADIKRVSQIWRECREKHPEGGPMLFGEFTIADAMFAPVALRFNTYDVQLDSVAESYVSTILAMPEMQDWVSAAKQETEVLADFEPYEKKG